MSITKTATGWRVSKQVKPYPRLRTIVDTYEEAERLERLYELGELDMQKLNSGNRQALTWKDLYNETCTGPWLHAKSKTQQENAYRIIESHLGWNVAAKEFSSEKAKKLCATLAKQGMAASTISKYMSAIRTMLKYVQKLQLINWELPFIPHYKATGSRIRFFTYEEEATIVSYLRQAMKHEHADLFTLLIETGLRTSEAMYLKWHNVDMEQRLIQVWADETKTGQSRRVPISQKAYEVLKARQSGPFEVRVFPRVTKRTMRTAWDGVRKALDVWEADFIWYVTRHTCATRLIKAGVDVATIKEMLGHARIETTMRYIQFHPGMLTVAAKALDDARNANPVLPRAMPPCHNSDSSLTQGL